MKNRTTKEWVDLLQKLSIEAEQDDEYFIGGVLEVMPITMGLGFTVPFMVALVPVVDAMDAVFDAAAGEQQLKNEMWPDNLEDKV